jgi:hypothetical protein
MSYPREEIEEMVERWLQANRDAEAAGDWKLMADLYTEDATYGWNYGPDTEFMAVGRDEIRELALGVEMEGLGGWEYPYQAKIIDPEQGYFVGFWKQVAGGTREDGTPYEIAGIGGSWFHYAGDYLWDWQRDWFDYGNAAALFIELMGEGKLSEGMIERMGRPLIQGKNGLYPVHKAPVGIWDLPT